MYSKIKQKYLLWQRKFSEAWLSCVTCMVGGDFTVVSWKHALVASETGLWAGIGVVIASFHTKLNNRWVVAWITGVMTTIADFVTHATHYGEHWHEAVLTGVGAGVLSLLLSIYLKK